MKDLVALSLRDRDCFPGSP